MRWRVPKPKRWLVLTLVVLVAAAGASGWLLLRPSGQAVAASTTTTVSSTTLKDTVSASGTIAAAKTADLDFEVSGTVTHVYVSEGDLVKKGQQLAAIDDTALQAALTAAQSSLDAAEEQYEEDIDDDASDVQLAADETAVVAAEADLDDAQQAVDDAVLRATIRGTVTAVGLEVGDVAGSSSGSSSTSSTSSDTSSSSAFSIVSVGSYLVDATVAATDVADVKAGLQAEITVSGVSDTVYGTVQSVGLVAQTNTSGAAVFPVTVKVTGKRDDLYSGTSATVSIIVSQETDVLVVASQALQTDDDGSTYVDKIVDGATVKTPVEIGETYGTQTEVVSGLAEGDTVEVPGFTMPTGGGTSSGDGEEEQQQMQFPDGGGMPGGGGQGGGGFGGGTTR
ncbi:efflux RND transporter periplasmic adaptor subunit [Nocardioides sp.]|uniref:efflux RND transporter periplasmic adaptor subunit n=1 Tax=Nocardioides sp. TaxID=35761 RepID=UPI0039E574A1